ncbi:uncharacterized protein [Antedon mediterranea]|uniref:uncharacterized protein isoform X2 n=1 Tax=Antedon mediterranea TaxID=105859 RepID=UPI003AF9265B
MLNKLISGTEGRETEVDLMTLLPTTSTVCNRMRRMSSAWWQQMVTVKLGSLLISYNDVVQPLACPSGKSLLKNQSEIADWMKRVEDKLNPDYEELNKPLKAVCQQ